MTISQENKDTYFVVFDGPSATGKDTLIAAIASNLDLRRKPYFLLSEDQLDPNRQAIKDARACGQSSGGTGDKEMAEVIIRHRAQIYQQVFPGLEQTKRPVIILANRGLPATLAYQTLRGEVTMSKVFSLHDQLQIRRPDLVVLTNCDPRIADLREKERDPVGRGLSGGVTREFGATAQATLIRRQEIHHSYKVVSKFLENLSIRVVQLDSGVLNLNQEVDIVLRQLQL